MNRLRVELWSDGVWVDISDDVEADGWSVSWSLDQSIHRTARIRLKRRLVWQTARVRLSGVTDDGEVFALGLFATRTPTIDLSSVPQVFDVECYDTLSSLRWSPGATFALDAGAAVIGFVENVLSTGTSQIDQTAVDVVAAAEMLWPLEASTTRLTIANEALATIGYRPVWSDPTTGNFRSAPDTPLGSLGAVHTFDAADGTTGLRLDRSFTEDDWDVPNQWIGIVDDASLVGGPITFTLDNTSEGAASQDATGEVRPSVLRVQAQSLDELASIVRGEASRALRALSSFRLTADWVPAITSAHISAVRVVDAALPVDKVLVVEEWTMDDTFSMSLTVAPVPVSFPGGVGGSPSVRAGATAAVDTFPAVVRNVSPLEVRLLGDAIDVGVPLSNAALTPTVDDVVSVGRVGGSWYVISELGAS